MDTLLQDFFLNYSSDTIWLSLADPLVNLLGVGAGIYVIFRKKQKFAGLTLLTSFILLLVVVPIVYQNTIGHAWHDWGGGIRDTGAELTINYTKGINFPERYWTYLWMNALIHYLFVVGILTAIFSALRTQPPKVVTPSQAAARPQATVQPKPTPKPKAATVEEEETISPFITHQGEGDDEADDEDEESPFILK